MKTLLKEKLFQKIGVASANWVWWTIC